MTEETLYPHEVIARAFIRVLKQPNSLSESISWILFAYTIMLIQEFVFYGMIIINESKITDVICIGFKTCINLTLVLFVFGLIGLVQSLSRSN